MPGTQHFYGFSDALQMNVYAHTKTNSDGTMADRREWEPLFTPFGAGENECQGASCRK